MPFGQNLPVHVELGPLPSSSALAWIERAREILGEVRSSGGQVPRSESVALGADVLDAFSDYLDGWQKAAEAGPVFRWSGDAEPEVVEYLLHAWFNLANTLRARAEREQLPAPSPEAHDFYQALVTALLDALAAEGREPTRAFAEELRAFWPGLDQSS
jgi:hypothetical protein